MAGLAAGLALSRAPGRSAEARVPEALFLSARGDHQGRHFVSGFKRDGSPGFDLALPGRGHAIARRPRAPEAVVFARRPGTFAVVLDPGSGETRGSLASPAGHHFYGHGVFSHDGRTLFTTENAFEAGRGVIGIWDATDGYRRVGAYPSHEIGPHDIGLLADGKTLVVANGGIMTHPDSGRAKLNLPEMTPSLAYVDMADGALRGAYRLPAELHRLSIRHLALGPGDRVALALQYEGPRQDLVPLVGLHGGEERIALPETPQGILRRMRNYGGGAAIDRGGRLLAVSCPRGNLVAFWRLGEDRFLGRVEVPDGCGIGATENAGEFMITSGLGGACLYRPLTGQKTVLSPALPGAPLWDNHLTPWI